MTDSEVRQLVDDLRFDLERRLELLEREVDQLRRRLGTHTREHDA